MNSYCPKDKLAWRNWLKKNHLQMDSVWLTFYKKSSQQFNLNWSDAVDQALCYGWIDSTKKSIDSEKYVQYFSKRKPKSNWSKINKEKVKFLIDQGLMQEAGYKSIELAKRNGSWTFLDAVEALQIPFDLQEEFKRNKGSAEYLESLSKSAKKILLYWVISAKRDETRKNRVSEVAINANQKIKPKQFR